MEIISKLAAGLPYLWMVFFIMIIAGLAKQYELFAPAYAYVKNTFRSNRFVVAMLSAIGGVLPIEGRVTVSAGLLDAVAPKENDSRKKLGIVDYLATHHYYLWSPLEKTVILPIAAFGLTYSAWIGLIAPLLLVSLLYVSWYIWTQIHEEEVPITPGKYKLSAVLRSIVPMIIALATYVYVGGQSNVFEIFGALTLYYVFITAQWDWRKLLAYVRWDVLAWVAGAIVFGNLMKMYSDEWTSVIQASPIDPSTFIGMAFISVLGFIASFLLGSSGKFIALAVVMAQAFGVEYFLWFFTVEFAGYLVSPTHKCVMVGNKYFGTPLSVYYKALGVWIGILLLTSGTITFLL